MLCKTSLCGLSYFTRFAASACVVLSLCSMGCRTGKTSGGNLFGFRSEPSAEALAGSGPSTTYPAPPSDSATPEAIASIAGGTIAPSTSPSSNPAAAPSTPSTRLATSGVPSYVTPGSNASPASHSGPNMAAAQANGMYGKTQPAGFAAPSWNAPVANAGSVSSGSMKSPDIKIPEMKVPQVKAASLQMPSGSANTNYAASIPTGYQFSSKSAGASKTVPSAYTIPSASSTSSAVAATGSSMGISMPGNFNIPTPKLPTAAATNEAITATFSDAKKAATQTVGEIASGVTEKITSVVPSQPPAPSQPAARISSTAGASYMPGSTSGASGYPGASDGYPTSSTSGSYLR